MTSAPLRHVPLGVCLKIAGGLALIVIAGARIALTVAGVESSPAALLAFALVEIWIGFLLLHDATR